jgi:hypothetical protein
VEGIRCSTNRSLKYSLVAEAETALSSISSTKFFLSFLRNPHRPWHKKKGG